MLDNLPTQAVAAEAPPLPEDPAANPAASNDPPGELVPTEQSTFNYDLIPNEEDRAFARAAEFEYREVLKLTSRNIGKILLKVRPRLLGQFEAWYLAMGLSRGSAYRAMAEVEAFPDEQAPTVGALDANTRDLLAHVPDKAARDGIVEQIKGGALPATKEAVREAVRAVEPKKTKAKAKPAKGPSKATTAAINGDNAAAKDKAINTHAAVLATLGPAQLDKLIFFREVWGDKAFQKALADAKAIAVRGGDPNTVH